MIERVKNQKIKGYVAAFTGLVVGVGGVVGGFGGLVDNL